MHVSCMIWMRHLQIKSKPDRKTICRDTSDHACPFFISSRLYRCTGSINETRQEGGRPVKTKEELNTLTNEVEALNQKLTELTAEELEQVTGGGSFGICMPVVRPEEPKIEVLPGRIDLNDQLD